MGDGIAWLGRRLGRLLKIVRLRGRNEKLVAFLALALLLVGVGWFFGGHRLFRNEARDSYECRRDAEMMGYSITTASSSSSGRAAWRPAV